MAATGSGRPAELVLTVTRQCQLRCSYCPTDKQGGSLEPQQARRAVALFLDRFGGGTVKLFGGEPLLEPAVVEAVLEVAADPRIRSLQLSTNGLALDERWLNRLRAHRRLVLALSLDGLPADHARHRGEGYEQLAALLPALRRTPRVQVTQTIAPDLAARAATNFRHLLDLGFFRFNLLPAYLVEWTGPQLADLDGAFAEIGRLVRARWAAGRRLHLRNLAANAPTPFFNTGLVVDVDGSLHVSNLALTGALAHLRPATCVGSLDGPPPAEALAHAARALPDLLRQALPPSVRASMEAVDAALSRLCAALVPAWLAHPRGAA